MEQILAKDKKYIWHPFTPLKGWFEPLPVVKAQGVYLYLEDGRKIIDAISSWWVNIHGHSHPTIAKALYDQALELEHVIFAGFTHVPAVQLAERLINKLGGNYSKVFFSDNGSTAVEVALKMALQYWENRNQKKKKFVAIEGAYHGDTFGAMAVGERGPFTAPFHDLLFEVEFIPFPTNENKDEVFRKMTSILKNGDVAAFIYEPLVQGAAGMRIYDAFILDELIGLAQSQESLCIADEVMTGFYRTGTFLASQQCVNQPDLICLSKGITGGTLPLSITVVSHKVEEQFQTSDWLKSFLHGHSYTGNPLACKVAVTSLDLLERDDCLHQIAMISEEHSYFVKKMAGTKGIKEVRSLGTILSISLDTGDQSSYFNEIRKKIYPYFLERGFLMRPLGNVIYLLPPYVISKEELALAYNFIQEFLTEHFS
jgi:adenosylmethionine---8-amino-7-oxononanoate aminotransferase